MTTLADGHGLPHAYVTDVELPHERLFGPTYGLDHRLFAGEQLRPEIRKSVLAKFGRFCDRHGWLHWHSWAKVVFFGSEASTWTSAMLEGNNDFDLSVGLHYQRFRMIAPSFTHVEDEVIAHEITELLHVELNDDHVWFAVPSLIWHQDENSISKRSSSGMSRTDSQLRQSQSERGHASRRFAGHSNLVGWSEADRRQDVQESLDPRSRLTAETVESGWSSRLIESSRDPEELNAQIADELISRTGTSNIDMGYPRRSMRPSFRPREEAARSVDGMTSDLSSTMTTSAVQGSEVAESAFEEFSALGAIRRSGISESNILGPHSIIWAGGLPPSVSLPNGWQWVGPFSQTWYANTLGYTIAKMRPYAALDVLTNHWIVRPPHLSNWNIHRFPQGEGLVTEMRGVAEMAQGILAMSEPYRTQQGSQLWEYIHSNRSRAFGDQGEGWWDANNTMEKFLDQLGLMQPLWELHQRASTNPHTLDAPKHWSNDPTRLKDG